MRKAALLSLLAILSFGLVLVACSSGNSDDASDDATPSSSETSLPATVATSDSDQPTSAATSDDGSSSIPGNVDVELTGGLEASWGSDAVAVCTSFSGQLNASISDLVNNEIYSLVVTQQIYTPGAYFLPEGGLDPNRNPSAQITTSSDSSKQWDLATGLGNGSIALAGGTAEAPLFVTIDGDLQDKNGGAPVHVTADVTCDVTIS